MHQPYKVCQVLKLPLGIESIKAYGEHLLVGTRQGHLLMYSVTIENDEDSEGVSSAHETSMTDSENGLDMEASNKSAEDASIGEKESEAKSFRPPEVKLSNKSLNTLEGLMLEGDLLEVSMDETQHMWRVLQATEPRRLAARVDGTETLAHP